MTPKTAAQAALRRQQRNSEIMARSHPNRELPFSDLQLTGLGRHPFQNRSTVGYVSPGPFLVQPFYRRAICIRNFQENTEIVGRAAVTPFRVSQITVPAVMK